MPGTTQRDRKLEIFLTAPPGLEAILCDEVREAGFEAPEPTPGGVSIRGGWPEVWRANLCLRGASRVLVRVAEFRAMHPAQLDKRARKVDWAGVLRADVPVRVEASCTRSKIYHAGAAAQRVERAITEELGASVSKGAALRIMVRIEDDLCTISVDSSGELLHRRGHKQFVGKAPLRETLASLFLRQCGYRGKESVLDPMCGSGSFVIEAAEIAAGLCPGRGRSFAFEKLASFNTQAWQQLQTTLPLETDLAFYGSDRDAGAIQGAISNAERAGVAKICNFSQFAISDLQRPEGPPGLVMVNPPYGSRIGNKKLLFGLYGALGKTLHARFSGWRVGLVTSEAGLARATGLPFAPPGPPIPHGGLKIRLWQTGILP
ncbi:THUMP domain-containing class I SAM-dependent RNA methyltransferase [Roseovarius aestuariivivens]|uniref:THUMP domain-containing class I SAM-dependent RNA methyltransferase n=1 Tax=Roseovarius aestuariivivens TaxID=1888910 RepID=UPI001080EC29|nr:class I SAM-dependent RNA methyltransferase [Roseovarius aestuariivivens]